MDGIDCAAEVWEALGGGQDAPVLTVPPDWEGIPGRAFGGFSVAALVAAAGKRATLPHPLSVHARFHRPVPIEVPVRVVVGVEREGRTMATYSAELRGPDDRLLTAASVAFGLGAGMDLSSQPGEAMPELVDPVPIAEVIAAKGVTPPRVMQRVGFRGATGDMADPGFHLHGDWPATRSAQALDQALVATMCIDNFSAPATMRANGVTVDGPWPAMAPNVDLTAWFHPRAAASGEGPARLGVRTEVARTAGGFAVGRTQVWAGAELAAEGMSQVVLIPVPS